jgi:hypothetical protein
MRWRQVVVLYVVLAALAGEYWFVERRRVPVKVDEPARPRFLTIEPAELREVRLEQGGRSVVSRLEDGAWRIVEPAGAEVPPDLIAAFTNALANAEEITRIEDGAVDRRAFGLDEGAVRVEMIAERREPLIVTLGTTNPTGTAIYAQRHGAPAVVLIGRNIRYYEELIFQALAGGRVPAADDKVPVG